MERLGIHNMYQLAHSDPAVLHKEFGLLGDQLFAISWGVDRSIIKERRPHGKSCGNSQILDRDYLDQRQIEIVIEELADQVASRIRAKGLLAGQVRLEVGYSYLEEEHGFTKQVKITPTDVSKDLVDYLWRIFRQNWQGQAVRQLGVSCGYLTQAAAMQLDLFISPEAAEKKRRFDQIVDQIRNKYGFVSLVRAASLLLGATAIRRSRLIGGHQA